MNLKSKICLYLETEGVSYLLIDVTKHA